MPMQRIEQWKDGALVGVVEENVPDDGAAQHEEPGLVPMYVDSVAFDAAAARLSGATTVAGLRSVMQAALGAIKPAD